MGTDGGARRALIIGGGIGGLSLAHAFQHKGIAATVFERSEDPTGKAVHLWSNATRALQRLGLLDQVMAVSTIMEAAEYRAQDGTLLTRWPLGDFGRKLGTHTIGISRPDLLGALSQGLPAETVQRGADCVGFAMDEAGVTAHFADGREERGDILIGSDGIRSVIRAQLWGKTPPQYAGDTVWRAIIDFPHDRYPLGVFRMIHGPGQRFMTYHVGGGRLLWLAAKNAPEGESDPSPDAAQARLLTMFKGWPAPIQEMIASTAPTEIRRNDVADLPLLTTWGAGRATLLGDAAHAMTVNIGQGACSSIEDAYVLAEEVARSSDWADGLRHYEARRKPRTTQMVKMSRRVGEMNQWENRLATGLRDQLMRRAFGVAWLSYKRTMAYEF